MKWDCGGCGKRLCIHNESGFVFCDLLRSGNGLGWTHSIFQPCPLPLTRGEICRVRVCYTPYLAKTSRRCRGKLKLFYTDVVGDEVTSRRDGGLRFFVTSHGFFPSNRYDNSTLQKIQKAAARSQYPDHLSHANRWRGSARRASPTKESCEGTLHHPDPVAYLNFSAGGNRGRSRVPPFLPANDSLARRRFNAYNPHAHSSHANAR